MQRFTNPRDLYHGKGALEALKTLEGKKAVICVGGGSMKRFGFLDRAKGYLEEAGMTLVILLNVSFKTAGSICFLHSIMITSFPLSSFLIADIPDSKQLDH